MTKLNTKTILLATNGSVLVLSYRGGRGSGVVRTVVLDFLTSYTTPHVSFNLLSAFRSFEISFIVIIIIITVRKEGFLFFY